MSDQDFIDTNRGEGELAPGSIVHRGTVEAWADGVATVRVVHDHEGGCATCGAREGCGLAASGGGKPASTVEVAHAGALAPGQPVHVVLAPNSDWKAILVAFALPVLLLMAGLLAGSALKLAELPIALLCLGALAVYAGVLVLFRARLRRSFALSIRSVD